MVLMSTVVVHWVESIRQDRDGRGTKRPLLLELARWNSGLEPFQTEAELGVCGWFGTENPAHCETQNILTIFCLIWEGDTCLDKTESINEVKRYMNSLCNVQKIEQVKPKMMFLVFFYNVVLLAFLLL